MYIIKERKNENIKNDSIYSKICNEENKHNK